MIKDGLEPETAACGAAAFCFFGLVERADA